MQDLEAQKVSGALCYFQFQHPIVFATTFITKEVNAASSASAAFQATAPRWLIEAQMASSQKLSQMITTTLFLDHEAAPK